MRSQQWFATRVTSSRGIAFGVLGPLEARLDGEPLPLGGAKQRAVLAVLLLSADEVISVERLIDEVWGDRSPPSAAHSLEAYVSRIRQLLNGHGPTLTRRGAGYRLDLGGATLDADLFAQELQGASDAAADGDLGLRRYWPLVRWHSGTGRLSPTSRSLRRDARRRSVSRRRGCARSSCASTRNWISDITRRSSANCRCSSARTPTANGSSRSSCSRCTAPAARRMRSTSTSRRGDGWTQTSDYSRVSSCNSFLRKW